MSLRDYDRLTPRERRERAALCAELRAKGILCEGGSCALQDSGELTTARAQDQKGAMPTPCQDNSVDAGVTLADVGEVVNFKVGVLLRPAGLRPTFKQVEGEDYLFLEGDWSEVK